MYLSCRREFFVTGSCLCEYRRQVDKFETFEAFFDEPRRSYLFRSHSGHYLHYSRKWATVEFKPCGAWEAQWLFLDRHSALDAGIEGNRSAA